MPFGDVSRPALGASLLAAAAKRDGFAATVRYFHLDLAAEIGLDEGALSDTPPRLDAIIAGDVCLVTDTRPVASAPVLRNRR